MAEKLAGVDGDGPVSTLGSDAVLLPNSLAVNGCPCAQVSASSRSHTVIVSFVRTRPIRCHTSSFVPSWNAATLPTTRVPSMSTSTSADAVCPANGARASCNSAISPADSRCWISARLPGGSRPLAVASRCVASSVALPKPARSLFNCHPCSASSWKGSSSSISSSRTPRFMCRAWRRKCLVGLAEKRISSSMSTSARGAREALGSNLPANLRGAASLASSALAAAAMGLA